MPSMMKDGTPLVQCQQVIGLTRGACLSPADITRNSTQLMRPQPQATVMCGACETLLVPPFKSTARLRPLSV